MLRAEERKMCSLILIPWIVIKIKAECRNGEEYGNQKHKRDRRSDPEQGK